LCSLQRSCKLPSWLYRGRGGMMGGKEREEGKEKVHLQPEIQATLLYNCRIHCVCFCLDDNNKNSINLPLKSREQTD